MEEKEIPANSDSQIEDIEEDHDFLKIYEKCRPYTMTSVERAYALYNSCKYIITNNIEGDFVECGVWKGGSSMIMALSLVSLNVTNRKIYLYDTFEGMSEPEDADVDIKKQSAKFLMATSDKKTSHIWSFASEEEVKNNLFSTDYPKENLFFIKGKVESTIPEVVPGKISLLRLDTDWYSSTHHELLHLYPRLTKSGILIVDDYGHWIGAKKAVDEYFSKNDRSFFLHRIDYTGRILVKQ
jgi:O-methyltransferase